MRIYPRVHTFKIGVYPPAILPSASCKVACLHALLLMHPNNLNSARGLWYAFSHAQKHLTSSNKLRVVSLAMEAIGDVTASAEVSRLPVDGIEFDSRIQGGVLVCTHLLVFSSPITSLSQTDVPPTE